MENKTFLLTLLGFLLIASIKIQAQTGWSISEVGTLHSLNSGITGKVFDAQTMLPITNVTVNLIGYSILVATNHNGRFVIPTYPASGYSLCFSALGYLPVTKTNIIFNLQNIAIVDSTYLMPSGEQEYDLVELSPNPNPQISVIKTGGLLKRYYRVIGMNSCVQTNGVDVEFKRADGVTKVFTSKNNNDQNGILIVELNQNTDIGCNYCSVGFRLSRVDNRIISNSPISFSVQVEPREYQKAYEIAREMEIGFGGAIGGHGTAKIGDQTAAKFILEQKYGNAEPYKLGIDMSFENWGGIEIGVGGGAKFEVGPVTGGIYGSTGAGGYLTFGLDGDYSYNYDSPANDEEARAKLLNLTLAAISLEPNPFFSRIAFVLSAISSWDYLGNISGGPGVKGSISGEALAGIFSSRKLGLGLGAQLTGSLEEGGKIEYEYNKPTSLHYGSLTIYDKAGLDLSIGLLTWQYLNPGNPNFKWVNKIIEKSKLGLTINILDWNRSLNVKYGGEIFSNPEIAFESKVGKTNWQRSFRINYSHNNLNSLLGTSLLQGIVSLANPNTPFMNFGEIGSHFINNAADNLLINIANKQFLNNYPPLDYEIDSSKVDNGFGLHLNIDWKIGISLDLGLNINWNTSYNSLIEKGVFFSGVGYSLENYSIIPEVDVPMSTVLVKIVLDGLRTFSLEDILNVVCIYCGGGRQIGNEDTDIIILAANGSSLEIDLNSIPPSIDSLTCNSWNWYGNSPVAKFSDLNDREKSIALAIKRKQQSVAKMDYGIGGFYKFEPQAVGLSTPAKLTIVYPDSDIVGIDENNLAFFYQDTTSNQWKYLGGVVNVDSNKISVYVDTLQLYTIAPIMPSGEIGLTTDRDTLETNEIDLATIISDTLKLANGNNVGTSAQYTVYPENLVIENEDLDTTLAGVQINSLNSLLQFQAKSTITPGPAKIYVESVNGTSKGILNLSVIDTTASIPLVLNSVRAIDNGAIVYVTNPDTNDIVQYEVYYGLQSGGPYNGKALAGGQDSPFIVSALDSAVIYSLFNDTTYYLAFKSVDRGGNRSAFSNELSIVPTDILAPSAISVLDFTLMPDNSFLARWIATGDNTNEGTATKYYLKISNQSIGDTTTWWQNATLLENETAPNEAGSYDYHNLWNVDTSYYLGMQVEDEVGLKSPISLFQINPNRGTRDFKLRKGWNLVSYPVKKSPLSVFDVLPFIEAGPFIYRPAQGYAYEDSLIELQGWWVKVSNGYEINLNGKIIEDTSVAVQNGWNLIGSNSSVTNTSNIYSQPSGIIQSLFWGYDSTGYYSSNEIKYGKGYWVKVNQNGNIILPKETGVLKKDNNPELMQAGFEISSNGTQRLLWIVDGNDLRKYEAPPLPPTEDIEVRFNGDLYAESEANSNYQIKITNGKYPIQIKSLIEDEEFEVIGNVTKKVYGKLTQNNFVKIDDAKDVILTLNKVTIPIDYYLSQNYPNPFNPTTKIKFGLPKDQKVKIVVYDILGQEVDRIINNEQLKAGHYTIEWNAAKYACGVYLLNIEAGSFTSVKKMMLVK
jgi:hypothetical protein